MFQHLLYEFAGLAMLAASVGMLWVARPVDGGPALFLRAKQRYEIGYGLIALFLMTGGLGCILLGFTT